MKPILYLLSITFLFFSACKSDGGKFIGSAKPKVETQTLEDTLLAVSHRGISFSNGTSEFLPFAGDTTAIIMVMVRHAEQDTTEEDPVLTEVGQARAERLAAILQDYPVSGIFTNAYIRTVKTVQPTAYQHQQAIQLYQEEEAIPFIQQVLQHQQGRYILIVGRANTVPQMLNELTGETKFSEIDKTDYSNIYMVAVGEGGKAVKVIRALY